MANRAKLQQGKTNYIFEYDPQAFTVSYSTELASNQVLDANDPDIRSRSTTSSYKLDRCLLVSAGLRVPQAVKMAALQALVLSRAPCRFSYGTVSAGTVYIAAAEFSIKSWTNGAPAHVEISLTLKPARSAAVATAQATAKVTARMKEDYKARIASYLQNPAQLRKLGLTAPVQVAVADDATVTLTSNGKTTAHTLSAFEIS